LEKQGIEHEVFDTTFSSKAELFKTIQDRQPLILAFYVNLMTKVEVLDLIQTVKSSGIKTEIVLGGPDIRYNWQNYLNHGADYVIFGEGEETFFELVQSIQTKKEIKDIQGLGYKDSNGKSIKNDERTRIKDINEIPNPNRQAIDLKPYMKVWEEYHGARTLSISTQRGCPYTCKWCSTAVYGQSYRRRDAKLVVDEIQQLIAEYKVEALWFVDDVFTVSHKWMEAFHKEMTERKIKVKYECITRAERLNASVIRQLKETGCFRVWIGAESGSQRIVDKMDRRVDLNQVIEMMHLTRASDIEVGTFIMIGYPSETIVDINLTIEYLKNADPDLFTITKTYPIKGTALYDELEGQLNEPEWSTSTDRMISFQREYKDQFYHHAIRNIVNSVNYYKASKDAKPLSLRFTYLIKAKLAEMAMNWYKN
jgi:radical SAM superfamily enzyme YgiQ (UPF0313 family)